MPDNIFRGGAFMLAATVMFSLSDTMAKYVTQSMPAVQLVTIRYLVFVLMAASPLLRSRRVSMRSRRPMLQILRGAGIVGSALSFILALGKLPVADATAINFVTPLVITALAVPVLGEVVRPQGWIAVAVGFAGMLIVLRPGTHGLQPAALLVLLCSLCWSMAMLVTRKLAGVDRSGVTILWTAVTGFVLLLAILPFNLAPMTWRLAALSVVVGVIASAGQWFAVLAYRHARATVLAPLSYGQLIWSSALGFVVFGAAPDRWVVIGAVIIALSGVYVVQLERARLASLDLRKREAAAVSPQRDESSAASSLPPATRESGKPRAKTMGD
jgi:drug/metabolite transporter (DMT)-like permease